MSLQSPYLSPVAIPSDCVGGKQASKLKQAVFCDGRGSLGKVSKVAMDRRDLLGVSHLHLTECTSPAGVQKNKAQSKQSRAEQSSFLSTKSGLFRSCAREVSQHGFCPRFRYGLAFEAGCQ